MIVRSEDFVPRPPTWEDDPDVSEDLKKGLRNLGFSELQSRVECLEIVDECFKCGQRLSTPYLYWQGAMGNLSLHPKCAIDLLLGLAQDAHQVEAMASSSSKMEAIEWLAHRAKKHT